MKEENRERVCIRMESRSDNEQFARVVAAVFAARLDPTVEEVNDIKTAVSEAVTNAIIHGYGEGEGLVELELAVCRPKQELCVAVRDWGCGIEDIHKAREPFYTTKEREGRSGMGFSFMEAFMDTLEIRSKPGEGTEVRMTKRIGRSGKG